MLIVKYFLNLVVRIYRIWVIILFPKIAFYLSIFLIDTIIAEKNYAVCYHFSLDKVFRRNTEADPGFPKSGGQP